jgi:hypothetical protein
VQISEAGSIRVLAVAVLFPLVGAVISISIAARAQPAPTRNYTSIEAIPDKPMQLGYYASAHKSNCTPAPLPTVRVIAVPKSGTLTVRTALLQTDKIAGCPTLKIPAQVVFYRPRADATGGDHVVYEVTSENGEIATYDVTINIKEAPKPSSATKKDEKI